MYPFIKWAGGKRQLQDIITSIFPKQYGDYYEPFIGAGAILLNLHPEKAYIGDKNEQLIHTYKVIRDSFDSFTEIYEDLNRPICTDERFKQMRDRYNEKIKTETFDVETACLFVWINRYCFNGLYRVNRDGLYNVPWGKREKAGFDKENIKEISLYLKKVEIFCQDFEETVGKAKRGDLIYFDSPYIPVKKDTFTSYTKDDFKKEDHERLADLFKRKSEEGCYCVLSNHDTELTRELYKGFEMLHVNAKRLIACQTECRNGEEIIVRNF